jgi:uncharacterized membrane protein (UPF0127 family)
VGFEPTTPALRERCSGQLSYDGGKRQSSQPLWGANSGAACPSCHVWEDRLERLPRVDLGGGVEVRIAATGLARLTGLAGLRGLPPGTGLLIPRCRSVHTVGMRFALDLIWLDGAGGIVDVTPSVPPRRVVGRRQARSVLEVRAGEGAAAFAALAAAPPLVT